MGTHDLLMWLMKLYPFRMSKTNICVENRKCGQWLNTVIYEKKNNFTEHVQESYRFLILYFLLGLFLITNVLILYIHICPMTCLYVILISTSSPSEAKQYQYILLTCLAPGPVPVEMALSRCTKAVDGTARIALGAMTVQETVFAERHTITSWR